MKTRLLAVVMAVAVLLAGCTGKSSNGKKGDSGSDISGSALSMVKQNGKWGIVDDKGKVVAPFVYDDVAHFSAEVSHVTKEGRQCFLHITKKGKAVELWDYDNVVVDVYDESSTKGDGMLMAVKSGKWGYLDDEGNEVIPCRYEQARAMDHGIALVKENGEWIVIDKKGKQVGVQSFQEIGSLFGELRQVKHGGKWGLLDRKGKTTLECEYDMIEVDYRSHSNWLVKKEGLWGVANESGRLVTECGYDTVTPTCADGYMSIAKDGKWGLLRTRDWDEVVKCEYDTPLTDCHCEDCDSLAMRYGAREVEKNGKWGIVNADGKVFVDCKYDLSQVVTDDLICVLDDGKWVFVNKRGHTGLRTGYEGVGTYGSGLCAVKKNGLWGYVNTKGKEVVPCKMAMENSLIPVCGAVVNEEGKWGFVDEKGNIAIDYQYDTVMVAHRGILDGMAVVVRDGKRGVVDTRSRKEVVECIYDKLSIEGNLEKHGYDALVNEEGTLMVWKGGKCGYANVKSGKTTGCIYDNFVGSNKYYVPQVVESNGKMGLVSKKGEEMAACRYDKIEIEPVAQGLWAVKQDGKWGLIDDDGEEVLACRYEAVEGFSDPRYDRGMVMVKQGGQWGIVGKNGHWLLLCDYEKIWTHD